MKWLIYITIGLALVATASRRNYPGVDELSSLFGDRLEDAQLADLQAQSLISQSITKSKDVRAEVAKATDAQLPLEVRLNAIKTIEESGSIEDSTRISSLLQLYNPLALRSAVSDAIEKIGCSTGCVFSILHYLERVWNGEHAIEDKFLSSLGESPQLKISKSNLETTLIAILSRNKKSTRLVLTEVYGLGSEQPSPTAIRAVDKIGLLEACPDLRRANGRTPVDESIRHQLQSVLDGTCRGR